MRTIKYLFIDITRCKSQLAFMAFFGMMAWAYTHHMESPFMGIAYIILGAVIVQASSFTIEQKKEVGFINLLPGSDKERVMARFLFGDVAMMIGMLFCAISLSVAKMQEFPLNMNHLAEIVMSFIGIGWIVLALQNILFYIIGRGNSQQVMAYIHMIPGFLLMIVMGIAYEFLGKEDTVNRIAWLFEHLTLVSVIVLVLGLVVHVGGIFIATKIVAKKDYV